MNYEAHQVIGETSLFRDVEDTTMPDPIFAICINQRVLFHTRVCQLLMDYFLSSS